MADTTTKYVGLDSLTYYDQKIKGYIADADQAVKENLESQLDVFGGALDSEIARAKAEEAKNATAASNAQTAADKAQTDVNTLAGKVGTVEDGKTVMGIIAQIQENAYDDTEVKGLISDLDEEKADKTQVATDIAAAVKVETDARTAAIEGLTKTVTDNKTELEAKIKTNTDAISVLNGTGDGSVKKTVDDAINEFATNVTDDAVINSYKELIDWVAEHGSEAAEMAAAIQANEKSIDDLEALVGTLPEGATATTVVALIQELVAAERTYADAEFVKDRARLTDLEADTHTHGNKALLDTYTQTEADLADAVVKKHSHANVAVIDAITSSQVENWDTAYAFASGVEFATNIDIDNMFA